MIRIRAAAAAAAPDSERRRDRAVAAARGPAAAAAGLSLSHSASLSVRSDMPVTAAGPGRSPRLRLGAESAGPARGPSRWPGPGWPGPRPPGPRRRARQSACLAGNRPARRSARESVTANLGLPPRPGELKSESQCRLCQSVNRVRRSRRRRPGCTARRAGPPLPVAA